MSDCEVKPMLRVAAYHEAGHAVACIASGVSVHSCELFDIEPDPTGLVQWAGDQPSLDDRIVILLAGELAHRRFDPDLTEGYNAMRCRSDREKVDDLLAEIGSDVDRSAKRKICEAAAREIIERDWCLIKAVAEELLCCPKLTGQHLERVIASCPQPKN